MLVFYCLHRYLYKEYCFPSRQCKIRPTITFAMIFLLRIEYSHLKVLTFVFVADILH